MNIGRIERITKSGAHVVYDASTPTRTKTTSPSAIIRSFSEIKPQPLKWLWPARIPLGKITLIVGDPGLGKSLATIDIAARVSRGTSFPDGQACEPGAVIILSAEDDPADTIRPRLDSAGADVTRVHILEGVRVTLTDNSTAERPFDLETGIASLEDLASLDSNLTRWRTRKIPCYLLGESVCVTRLPLHWKTCGKSLAASKACQPQCSMTVAEF